jgi:hypothetical protein
LDAHKLSIKSNHRLILDRKNALAAEKDRVEKVKKSDFVPCLFFKAKSKKVMVHFHANGEDVA